MTPADDFHPRRVHLHNKSGNLASPVFWRGSRHHHDHTRLDSICAPEFFAIEDEMRAVWRWFGMCLHLGRIGTNLDFRQRKRRDLSGGYARKKTAFLLVSAEKKQGLGNTDRLMRGEQRRKVATVAPEKDRSAAIVRLRKAESAVFRGNLDPERAQFRQGIEYMLR